MAEKNSLFKSYSASGEGIIDSGYYQNCALVVQVVSGSVDVFAGTESAAAEIGDYLFVPSDLVFRICSYEGNASVRVLLFDTSVVQESMESIDEDIYYMFNIQACSKIAVFHRGHPIYETIVYCMNEAYEEYIAKDVCYRLPVKAHIMLLFSALLRFYSSTKNELDKMVYHNVMRLRPVIEYINENYHEKIYIETLSDMITVSPDYFTKMFKDSIGKTPIDYINGIRVNHSLRLLSVTDTPINDISDGLGFSNPNYFHKIFKSYMGTSPLAYRKSVKGK